jgi:hypothetical protein
MELETSHRLDDLRMAVPLLFYRGIGDIHIILLHGITVFPYRSILLAVQE